MNTSETMKHARAALGKSAAEVAVDATVERLGNALVGLYAEPKASTGVGCASVRARGALGETIAADVYGSGDDGSDADNMARLFAAAPDLLAALVKLRDLRDQWRNDDRYSSLDYMDAIDALPWEAAIARAEGGAA